MKRASGGNAGSGRLSIIILVACAGMLLVIYGWLSYKNEEVIKIGLIIPLSGPASQHKVVADAVRLAAEEVNSSGGIDGRRLELIIKDSQSDKEEGKKAFNEMETGEKPLLYISTTSAVSSALAPLAEEHQVVLVGLVVAAPKFTDLKRWIFKYYVSAEHEAKPIMSILKQLNVKRLGILYQDDKFGVSHQEIVKDAFEKTGGEVISEPFLAKTTDFKKQIAALKDTEAVYIAGFVNVVGEAIKQLRAGEYKGFLLSHSGCTSLPRSMPGVNDVYVAAPIIYKRNYTFAQNAKEKYEMKYHQLFTHQAANGYDFIKIFAGLMDGRKSSRENVRRVLEGEFAYPGLFGYIEKRKGEHDIHFPLFPARIVNGEIVYLPYEYEND